MAKGITTSGDLILADGTNINVLWDDYWNAIATSNSLKDTLKGLLSYGTTVASDLVIQSGTPESFEDATEFGLPTSIRSGPPALKLGYNFRWRDGASRYTWRFLRTATRDQVDALFNEVLAADTEQVFRGVLGALFNNNPRTSPEGTPVYPLYNGDGTVPPEYNGRTFTADHTHYLTSGAAVVDGVDLKDLITHVRHHGHTDMPGARLLVFANEQEMDVIRGFKAGQGTPASPWDFIPSVGSDAFLSTAQIIGTQPPATYGKLHIAGSFGPAWVSESPLIPAGYLLAVVSHGSNSNQNVVGFREHEQAELQGLIQVAGPNGTYPLLEASYMRGFGTGVRQRGGAAVMQITTGTDYGVPSQYATVIA